MSQSRKVIVFVVEGPSDETSWAVIFKKLYEQEKIVFDVMHMDIFTEEVSASSSDVLNKLRQRIKDHAKREHYLWRDISKVVVLTDSDGAFISGERVIEGPNEEIEYRSDCIVARNPDSIRKRNAIKKRGIYALRSRGFLTDRNIKVPLELYYLSRNLEHVLHGRKDYVTDEEKRRLSHSFRRRYESDVLGFKRFMSESGFAVSGTYEESWEFIGRDTNSLKRYSNVHLLFDGS